MHWTKPKFKNTKVRTSDGVFDSKKEYARWNELKVLETNGVISGLKRQVPFELVPTQKLKTPRQNGKRAQLTERPVSYIADFCYVTNDDLFVVEDTKGMKTPEYIIKRKLMLWRYGIQIKEL